MTTKIYRVAPHPSRRLYGCTFWACADHLTAMVQARQSALGGVIVAQLDDTAHDCDTCEQLAANARGERLGGARC